MLPFENKEDREYFGKHYTSTVKIKDFNALIDAKSFFNVPIKSKGET